MEITGKIDTERAATVGIITYDNPEDEVNASLDELERLLETAGGRAVIRLVQSKENPDVRTFLGSGKMKELAELCRGNDVTLVVCDSELSPSQIRNMEDILDSGDPERPIRVIDRSMLILDIFYNITKAMEIISTCAFVISIFEPQKVFIIFFFPTSI